MIPIYFSGPSNEKKKTIDAAEINVRLWSGAVGIRVRCEITYGLHAPFRTVKDCKAS